MILVTGKYLGYTETDRRYNDKQTGEAKSFVARDLHVLTGLESMRLGLAENYTGGLPKDGEDVVIEVVPRVSGSRVYWTALRNHGADALIPA